jgi:hypothetical protein
MRIEITVEGQEPFTHKLTKDKTLLGSGSECDILVEAEGLSRKHVMILAEGDQFFVVDQGSTNGAFINEERLVPGQRASFTSFFPIRLGAHVTVALLSDEESTMASFDFAKELSKPAERTSPAKTSPNVLATESKATFQSRSGFSSAPAASTRRSGQGEGAKDKRVSKSESEGSQAQLIKTLAFVVAFGGSALFFFLKESPDEVAARPVVETKLEAPAVNLSSFELKPMLPLGLEQAPNALNGLKCSTQEELGFCRGLGLPVKDFGLSGAVFAPTYITAVLPVLKGDEALAYFGKDVSWDDATKSKLQNVTDPRDLIAMFILSSQLDTWARLSAEKRWLYVIFVSSTGSREGDLWVADLTYIKSLGMKSEEFFGLQTSFRTQGVDAVSPLAGLFRRVAEPEAAGTP